MYLKIRCKPGISIINENAPLVAVFAAQNKNKLGMNNLIYEQILPRILWGSYFCCFCACKTRHKRRALMIEHSFHSRYLFFRYIVDVSVTKDRKFITINCNSRSTSEVSVTAYFMTIVLKQWKLLSVINIHVAGMFCISR